MRETVVIRLTARLEDLLQRKARKARLEDIVHLDRVRGLIKTIYWRRRFLKQRATSGDLPVITVGGADTPKRRLSLADVPRSPAASLSPSGSPGDTYSVFWAPGSPISPSPAAHEDWNDLMIQAVAQRDL